MIFKNKGFSIVELLIAVSIIGILSAIAIANYGSYKKNAEEAEAKHLLSRIYGAEKQFYQMWNTYHENLVVIGAISENMTFTNYNAGFNQAGATITDHPGDSTGIIKASCIDYSQICTNSSTSTASTCGLSYTTTCSSSKGGTLALQALTGLGTCGATDSKFSAVAYAGTDRNTIKINEKRIVGTGNCP